jgi:hypothetical protein
MISGDGNPLTSDGIFVYQTDGATTPGTNVNIGDIVRVTGVVTEAYNQTELVVGNSATGVNIVTAGAYTPAQVISNFAVDVNLPANGTITAGGRVLQGRLNGVLALSRAFGDGEHKAARGDGPCSAVPQAWAGAHQRLEAWVPGEGGVDDLWVGRKVKNPAQPRNDRGQSINAGKIDGGPEARPRRLVRHRDVAGLAAQGNGAAIEAVADHLHPRNGVGGEKRQHLRPVIGGPVGEAERQRRALSPGIRRAPQACGRPAKEGLKGFIEAPDRAKAAGKSDFSHAEAGFVQKLLGQ